MICKALAASPGGFNSGAHGISFLTVPKASLVGVLAIKPYFAA